VKVPKHFIIKSIRNLIILIIKQLRFIGALLFRIIYLIGQLFPSDTQGCKIRGIIYKPLLKKCGRNFQVGLGAKLENVRDIEVGNNVYIGPDCWICGIRGGIVLEDEVMLGPKICMVSSNHSVKDKSFRFGPGIGMKIVIGRGTWIAAGVSIMAGVTIGECCLIAAGAVVTKDAESFSIVGGIPAKKIGSVIENYKIEVNEKLTNEKN
jgi:acetyltransferase-like isoleucine patch superfamily enzyme